MAVSALCLFLTVPCLQCVIVACPGQTHSEFSIFNIKYLFKKVCKVMWVFVWFFCKKILQINNLYFNTKENPSSGVCEQQRHRPASGQSDQRLFYSLMGDFKNNASISLINVYRLSKADLLLKLILRYVINVFLASCQVLSL